MCMVRVREGRQGAGSIAAHDPMVGLGAAQIPSKMVLSAAGGECLCV